MNTTAGYSDGKDTIAARANSAVLGAQGETAWSAHWGRRRQRAFILFTRLAGDVVVTALSVVLAYLLQESWPRSMGEVQRTPFTMAPLLARVALAPEFAVYLPLLLLAPITFLVVFQWRRLYRQDNKDIRPFRDTGTIFKGTFLSTLLLVMVALSYSRGRTGGPLDYPSLFFVYFFFVASLGLILFRSGVLIGLLGLHLLGMGRTRVAVIDSGEAAPALLAPFRSPSTEYDMVGYVTLRDQSSAGAWSEALWLGPLASIRELINKHDLGEIILAVDPSHLSADQRLDLAQTCWQMGAELKMVPPFYPFFHTRTLSETLGGIPLLQVERVGLYATIPQVIKRAADIAISLCALVAASPILLAATILIKLDSPGPVLFVQQRVGLNGRTFRMFKFRSMKTGNDPKKHEEYLKKLIKEGQSHAVDENGKPVFKIANDPRITRVGRIIRKTSIDELPQLFNVLNGTMSLVGPRPPLPYEVAVYEDWHMKRLNIRPGCTGLWQVSGRSRLSFEEMVRLDIRYIEQWSPWLDLKILLKTVPVLLKFWQSY
ncbi:MAG: sugar transferase [Candidatus Hydrogenedentes bacterium]|nr:sugar transferase [Candidatus Hydrogenedentota bacterium]